MLDLTLPPLRITEHEGFRIVRDDLVLGGTKARVVAGLMTPDEEWVYAGPATGYAQLALAVGAVATGARAALFVAKRASPHPISLAAAALGMPVFQVPAGRLSVVTARARSYCEQSGARLLPLGLRLPGLDAALASVAAAIEPPEEAWVAVGSGSLAAALAEAWPESSIHGVQVGARPRIVHERVTYHASPEPFDRPASGPRPPVPSVDTYDAKVWRFVVSKGRPGALWWNVGGPPPSVALARAAIAAGTLDLADPRLSSLDTQH